MKILIILYFFGKFDVYLYPPRYNVGFSFFHMPQTSSFDVITLPRVVPFE